MQNNDEITLKEILFAILSFIKIVLLGGIAFIVGILIIAGLGWIFNDPNILEDLTIIFLVIAGLYFLGLGIIDKDFPFRR